MDTFKDYYRNLYSAEVAYRNLYSAEVAEKVLKFKSETQKPPLNFLWLYQSKSELIKIINDYILNKTSTLELFISKRLMHQDQLDFNVTLYIHNREFAPRFGVSIKNRWELCMSYPKSNLAIIAEDPDSNKITLNLFYERDEEYFLRVITKYWTDWMVLYDSAHHSSQKVSLEQYKRYFQVAEDIDKAGRNISALMDLLLKYGLPRSDYIKLSNKFGVLNQKEVGIKDMGHLF